MIIDVHCGFGPTAAAPGWGSADALIDALDARSVAVALIASRLARAGELAAGNADVADACAAHPQRLRGWVVLDPSRPVESSAEARKYLYDKRFVGGALFPPPAARGGLGVTFDSVLELVTAFRRYAKPLLVHTPTAAAMQEVAQLARQLSSVRFIASGMGGNDWREAIDVALPRLNVYLDISGVLVSPRLAYMLSLPNGARKLVFASGAPNTDPAALVGLLDDLDLSGEDRERILFANAARLLGLGAGDATDDLAPVGI